MRHPREIEKELKEVLKQLAIAQTTHQELSKKRLELIAEYRGFSSSIVSNSALGQPGVIQGPPPKKENA